MKKSKKAAGGASLELRTAEAARLAAIDRRELGAIFKDADKRLAESRAAGQDARVNPRQHRINKENAKHRVNP